MIRVCRSQQRGEEARAAICESTGSQRVLLHTCDISDLSDIRRFVRQFAGSGHSADCLINNAGGMAATVVRTREGAEQSFAANVLGMLSNELHGTTVASHSF
jgi:NAD(P)-dependent dehydrogenase (short-subunit alcohol dehydrogenase family)